ncbi:hypothetical protein ACFWQ1_06420 [Streptomyces albidoflavus]|uniref:hypothetical protein n=1 Tax=Streptomyces TaxID=1883 RepID=UPI000A50C233|nr:hypothetical protein [Streptomyces sp. CNQ431]UYM24378.1 hypothetical protein NQP46_15935 [Streptomyces albus]
MTRTDATAEPVRSLLREHHPDLAGLPLSLAARGRDNPDVAARRPPRGACAVGHGVRRRAAAQGHAWTHGRPGGKAGCGPPARRALERLVAAHARR